MSNWIYMPALARQGLFLQLIKKKSFILQPLDVWKTSILLGFSSKSTLKCTYSVILLLYLPQQLWKRKYINEIYLFTAGASLRKGRKIYLHMSFLKLWHHLICHKHSWLANWQKSNKINQVQANTLFLLIFAKKFKLGSFYTFILGCAVWSEVMWHQSM